MWNCIASCVQNFEKCFCMHWKCSALPHPFSSIHLQSKATPSDQRRRSEGKSRARAWATCGTDLQERNGWAPDARGLDSDKFLHFSLSRPKAMLKQFSALLLYSSQSDSCEKREREDFWWCLLSLPFVSMGAYLLYLLFNAFV